MLIYHIHHGGHLVSLIVAKNKKEKKKKPKLDKKTIIGSFLPVPSVLWFLINCLISGDQEDIIGSGGQNEFHFIVLHSQIYVIISNSRTFS